MSEGCLADGMVSSQNKTLPANSQERNEESCSNSRRVVTVEVVVEPVVVLLPVSTIPDEVAHIEVVVRVAVM